MRQDVQLAVFANKILWYCDFSYEITHFVTSWRCYGQARTTLNCKENTLKEEESLSTRSVLHCTESLEPSRYSLVIDKLNEGNLVTCAVAEATRWCLSNQDSNVYNTCFHRLGVKRPGLNSDG